MNRPSTLRPDRIRRLERPFGWAPFRLLTSGLLSRLGPPARQLYLVLCLVSDRQGLSFYSDGRLALLLAFDEALLIQARQELVACDLLAYDGHTYQLLSLPSKITSSSASPESLGDILCRLGVGGKPC